MKRLSRIFLGLMLLTLLTHQEAMAQTTVVDFESVAPQTQVTQIADYGITFHSALVGVACSEDPVARQGSNCLQARSGERVVTNLWQGEFQREVIDIEFSNGLDSVAVYVRYDHDDGAVGQDVLAFIEAYGEEGQYLGRRSISFVHDWEDNQWRELRFTPFVFCLPDMPCPTPPKVHRVEIWGGEARHFFSDPLEKSEATNFFLIDDLTLDGELFPLEEDTEPPTLTLFELPASTETLYVDVRLRVVEQGPADSRRLATIDRRVTHETEGVIDDYTGGVICGGPGSFRACPDLVFDENMTIGLGSADGAYTLEFRACDAAGNCAETSATIVLDQPAPPPVVRPLGIEINQSVIARIFDVDGPGTIRSASGGRVNLVAGKDTLVRFYLYALGDEARTDFSGTMLLRVWDDRTALPSYSRNVIPNTQDTVITVPADPGSAADRMNLRHEMRPDATATLNFIIPGHLIANAEQIEVSLIGVTGRLTARIQPAVTLGLYTIQMNRSGPRLLNDEELNGVVDFVRTALPIAELLFPDSTTNRWEETPALIDPYITRLAAYSGSTECGSVLSWVRNTFAGDSLPTANVPDFVVTLGIPSAGWLDGCLGKAYTSGPPSAISYPDSNAAPHEIGHTMGIEHASNDHDEEDGGGSEPWPYRHGMIGRDGFDIFGALIQQASAEPADLGTWEVHIIDPCPGATFAQRGSACAALGDTVEHDFMSYGPFLNWTSTVLGPKAFRWLSDITYNRIYNKLRTGILSPPSGSLAAAAAGVKENTRAEAFLISGRMDAGQIELLWPLLRKSLPAALLTPERSEETVDAAHADFHVHVGENPSENLHINSQLDNDTIYLLAFEDAEGAVLAEYDVKMQSAGHDEALFWLAVPYHADARRMVIADGDEILLAETASEHAPTVEITYPSGGEILATGAHTVTWEAEDADGDALSYLVQVSPDGGESWYGLTTIEPGGPSSTTLNVDELPAGAQGVVRVTASDGFLTSVAYSGTFSMGTDEPPASDEPPDDDEPDDEPSMSHQLFIPGLEAHTP